MYVLSRGMCMFVPSGLSVDMGRQSVRVLLLCILIIFWFASIQYMCRCSVAALMIEDADGRCCVLVGFRFSMCQSCCC
jgi:hypothetical protein